MSTIEDYMSISPWFEPASNQLELMHLLLGKSQDSTQLVSSSHVLERMQRLGSGIDIYNLIHIVLSSFYNRENINTMVKQSRRYYNNDQGFISSSGNSELYRFCHIIQEITDTPPCNISPVAIMNKSGSYIQEKISLNSNLLDLENDPNFVEFYFRVVS